MTLLQIMLLLAAATVTFISYQVIPNGLERAGPDKSWAIATSSVFTVFVRACGVDHLVMAFGMVGLHLGWFDRPVLVWWVIVASSIMVAVVSAISAITIRGLSNETVR